MDDIVRQALHKWPNVPHCYGWLGLDARGHWRMRDERAQQLGLAGEKIVHAALLGFIARNYTHDERACWYFQNGPQRVYVDLEATPHIARTEAGAKAAFVLHTGAPLDDIDEVLLAATGQLILRHGGIVAQLDDRDMAQVVDRLEIDGRPIADEALLGWLAGENGQDGELKLRHRDRTIPVQRIVGEGIAEGIAARFGFCRRPAAVVVESA
jgi:hypothetical protein